MFVLYFAIGMHSPAFCTIFFSFGRFSLSLNVFWAMMNVLSCFPSYHIRCFTVHCEFEIAVCFLFLFHFRIFSREKKKHFFLPCYMFSLAHIAIKYRYVMQTKEDGAGA